MEPGELWDQVVASALSQVSTKDTARRLGMTKLHPATKGTALPIVLGETVRISRNPAMIADSLRATIRGCINGEQAWPLLIFGPAGAGKTSAALCVLDFATGSYHTASGLCSMLIQSQQGRLEWVYEGRGGTIWPEKMWSRIASMPFVALDEIGGRDRVTDHHYEAVKTMLDVRQGKPLMVLSNLGLPELEKIYDDRIASRLASGTVVRLEGKDRRLHTQGTSQ